MPLLNSLHGFLTYDGLEGSLRFGYSQWRCAMGCLICCDAWSDVMSGAMVYIKT